MQGYHKDVLDLLGIIIYFSFIQHLLEGGDKRAVTEIGFAHVNTKS